MEIIIIFVVVSIITNIIKAIGNSKAELGETPSTTVKKQSHWFVEEPKTTKVRRGYAAEPVMESPGMPYNLDTSIKKRRQEPPEVARSKEQISNREISITLTPETLVQGIVLSEILAPPKSRRQN